jgi:hypothetical protein
VYRNGGFVVALTPGRRAQEWDGPVRLEFTPIVCRQLDQGSDGYDDVLDAVAHPAAGPDRPAVVWGIAVLTAAGDVSTVMVVYSSPADADEAAKAHGLDSYRVVPLSFPHCPPEGAVSAPSA